MSKFNTTAVRRVIAPVGPIATKAGKKPIATHEGGDGARRDKRSELFLLAVTNMVGERSEYESADERDARYRKLIRKLAVDDGEWTAQLLTWLRGPQANLRTAAIVGAAEFVHARLAAGIHGGNREVVRSVLQRADEPGEFLAYWTGRYGWPQNRSPREDGKLPTAPVIPKPVRRGVADAVSRLYSERTLIKYDTSTHGWRFGDVIDLTHPTPAPEKPWQGDLFAHALDRRHNRDNDIPTSLTIIGPNASFKAFSPATVDMLAAQGLLADCLTAAGMTWEQLSAFGAWTAKRWEAVIPSMGYMALLKNLRNFDQAGVSNEMAAKVAAKLADPEEVSRSRQLPMQFLSAYNAAPSLRWAWALEQALDASLANIPSLKGRTLILIDTSTSMRDTFSKDGTLRRWDAAALFGIALGARCENADVVSYSSTQKYHGDVANPYTRAFERIRGESVLKAVQRWKSGGYFLGGGTYTSGATRAHFANHDRVVLLTDEQAGDYGYTDPGQVLPARTPLYTWNLAGYRAGHGPNGPYRHSVGGLTDAGFRLISLLEAGKNATWPWLLNGPLS